MTVKQAQALEWIAAYGADGMADFQGDDLDTDDLVLANEAISILQLVLKDRYRE